MRTWVLGTGFRAWVLVPFALAALRASDSRAALRAAAGNPLYTIVVEDECFFSECGAWTPATGPAHPLGPDRNLFFFRDAPGWSFTTLQSWRTRATYINAVEYPTTCAPTWFAEAATSFDVAPIESAPGTVVGFRVTWTFDDDADGSDDLQLVQETVVEVVGGGASTVDNTLIRETHAVTNLAGVPYPIGLRKLWDFAVGVDEFFDLDETPFVGPCPSDPVAPRRACDLSFDLFDPTTMPETYVIDEAPDEIDCAPAIADPDGVPETPCGRPAQYLVGATVTGPALVPPPTPPDQLEWGEYWRQLDECFGTRVPFGGEDPASCARYGDPDEGDAAMIYTWGLTAARPVVVPVGGTATFTQYLCAFPVGACPAALSTACAAVLQPDAGPDLELCPGEDPPPRTGMGSAAACASAVELAWVGPGGPVTGWGPAPVLDLSPADLAPGANTYELVMRCADETCLERDAVTFTVTPATPPEDVGNPLRVGKSEPVGATNLELDWRRFGPPSRSGDHFHVYRALDPSGPFTRLSPDPALVDTAFTDAGVPAGRIFYEVRLADRCEGLSGDAFPHTMPSTCFESSLACGHAATTALEPTCASALAAHACAPGDTSGDERVHRLALTADATVRLTLRDATPALILVVYDAALRSCLAGGPSPLDVALPAGEYRVVVDGPVGAGSAYTLAVACR
jgi:hypothetical protein